MRVNPYVAGAGLLRENWGSIMAVDVLATCVARPLAAMIFIK